MKREAGYVKGRLYELLKLTNVQIEDFNACLQATAKLMVHSDAFDVQKTLDSLEHKPDMLADLRGKLDLLLARVELRRMHEVYLPFECALASLTLLEAPTKIVDLSRALLLDLMSDNHKLKPDLIISQLQDMMQDHLRELAGRTQQLAKGDAQFGIVKPFK